MQAGVESPILRLAQAKGRLLLTDRVEYLVSGQTNHFQSAEQLLRFIEQVLTSVSDKPP